MLESVPGQGRLFVLLKKASSNFRVSIVYLRIDLLELLADYPETGTGANYICFNKYFTAEERHSPQLITPRFFRPVLWKQPVPVHGAAAASAGNPVDLGSSGLTAPGPKTQTYDVITPVAAPIPLFPVASTHLSFLTPSFLEPLEEQPWIAPAWSGSPQVFPSKPNQVSLQLHRG